MIQISYDYDSEGVVFTTKEAVRGLVSRLLGTQPEARHVDRWAAGDAGRCDTLGALRAYGEDHPDAVRFENDRILTSHAAVAALDAAQARAIGLPNRPPFVLSTDTSGVIGAPDFKLTTRWLDAGQRITAHRQGAFLETAKGTFLIPEPLFSAIELADHFDANAVDLPEHWAALARFRHLLDPNDDAHGDRLEMSGFLRGLRIYAGAALSLTLSGDADDVEFDPVPFDADAARQATDEGRPLAESDGMLTEEMLQTFQGDARTGFRAFDTAKRSYLIGRNTYLIVDDDVEAALQVVRQKQRAGPEERRAFAANPRAAIAERLAEGARTHDGKVRREDDEAREEETEVRAAALFFETPEYADRAIGIGLWEKPNLDFIPHVPNVWLPEIFTLELGGVWIRLDGKAVLELRNVIDTAIEAGVAEVDYKGQRLPATKEVRDKLAGIVGIEKPGPAPEDDTSGSGDEDDD